MHAIEVENLTKRFGDFTAVDALNFFVESGEVFGLLGPNGAGKSTLIRMLTTLVPPTSGTALVNGFDIVRDANGVRQSIGVIPQAMTSDLDLSAEENMGIFAKLYGIPREKRLRTIKQLLREVDLEKWADKPVKMFSGGMRRRLEIARGLVHEPRLFFLDEPTTGLDPVSRVAVWEMLTRLKNERALTILMTTHYMDEADKLCDRIAIVDHGKLVALDSPLKLKASIPGKNILEVSFSTVPQNWIATLTSLPDVAEVKANDNVFRLASHNGPRTTVSLMEAARAAGATVNSLSVQSTTLDDVFVHYTGHQLRDTLQSPTGANSPFLLQRATFGEVYAPGLGHHPMHRVWAIIERDLRRFRRSPVLVIVSILMPLVQLVVLGYAFGGKIKNLHIGVVDQDHGVPAVKLREMCQAVAANASTFEPIMYDDMGDATRDLRNGRINGILNIPPEFSRKVLAGANPRVALVEDNTDQFAASALQGSLDGTLLSYNGPSVQPRTTADVSLSVVEIYPYVPYIQFLLPGTITLSIFVSAMIGGGIIFIDDKARGLHEGYLVTPIRKFELILGFTLAGAAKAIIAGFVLITVGSIIAGVPDPLNPLRIARMLLLVVVTSMALISMMFLIMVRVSDPLVPRAIFGMLNTVLYFPSGAVYPTQSFPAWMKAIAVVDPFTYAVDGFKELALKNTGLGAITFDLAFLTVFTALTLGAATMLFRRTL